MQNIAKRAPVAFGVAVAAALGLAATDAAAQEQQVEQQEEEITCVATLAPASLITDAEPLAIEDAEPLAIEVAFSEEIGTTKEVLAQEGSGLEVVKVEKPKKDEMQARAEIEEEGEPAYEPAAEREPAFDVLVRLNASEATTGSWELRFEGTEGVCLGTIDVALPAEEVESPPEVENAPEGEETGEPPLL